MHVDGFKGRLFKPLHPVVADPTRTLVGVLPMPGDHSQVVKAGAASPGKITVDMAIRFLRACGSEDAEPQDLGTFKLSYRQICDYYQQIRAAVLADDGSYCAPEKIGFFHAAHRAVRYSRKTGAEALKHALHADRLRQRTSSPAGPQASLGICRPSDGGGAEYHAQQHVSLIFTAA